MSEYKQFSDVGMLRNMLVAKDLMLAERDRKCDMLFEKVILLQKSFESGVARSDWPSTLNMSWSADKMTLRIHHPAIKDGNYLMKREPYFVDFLKGVKVQPYFNYVENSERYRKGKMND